jgi:hypothetical protein
MLDRHFSFPSGVRSYILALFLIAAEILQLSLNACAPISPNAKYLFAPEVRTCPPYRAPNGLTYTDYPKSQWCAARVKEPVPTSGVPGDSIVSVSQATNYARQIEEEYTGAKSEYGSINSTAGVLLIPAGTSALALGAEGGSASVVTSLGFGGAGLLGMSYWLANSKRETAYMTGVDALECLISTMQPFDVEQTDFARLDDTVGDWANAYPSGNGGGSNGPPASGMAYANFEVESDASYLGAQLAILKTNPDVAADACLKPALCYAEQVLKVAGLGTQAASKAYDAQLKYEQFSKRLAGDAMVGLVNSINNKVNKVMTETEPNLQALAGELKSVIPESAQSLAGISSASSTASAASTATLGINFGTAPPGVPAPGSKGGISIGSSCKDTKHPIDPTTEEAVAELFKRSERLQWRTYRLNSSTETVVNLTPANIAPKTDNCTKLFDQSGIAPPVLSLNPQGRILLKPGASQDIAVTGGKPPYEVRLMCDCYGNGVSAIVAYEGPNASLKLAATASAKSGYYPVNVADSTGIEKSIDLIVDQTKKDDSDLPDCASTNVATSSTVAGGTSKRTVAAIVAASNSALAADRNAQESATRASTAAGKAASETSGDKIVGYLSQANAAASQTRKFAKSAQTYAARVAALVAVENDSTLQVYQDAAQAAATDAATTQVQSSESAVKQITSRLSTVIGKGGA